MSTRISRDSISFYLTYQYLGRSEKAEEGQAVVDANANNWFAHGYGLVHHVAHVVERQCRVSLDAGQVGSEHV